MKEKPLAAGALVLLLAVAAAANDDLGFEVTSDFYGRYIWRGQDLSDDPVYQPGASLTWGKFTLGLCGNMDLTNINGNSGDFSELDYSLDFRDRFPGAEGLSYSVGVIYYDFPGTAVPDTTEVYWGLALDLPLNPAITVYHDVDEAEGTYVNLGFSHSIEEIAKLGDARVGMEIGAGLGWASGSYNSYYWGTDQSKMQDFTFSAAFPVEILGWTVGPSFNYVTLLSDDIRSTDAYNTDSDYFFAGVSISKAF